MPEDRYMLDEPLAEALLSLPLKCVFTEYPNKLNQVLADESEMGTPKELHPAFYGCFDWHSAVHAHWTMLRLLRTFPDKNRELAVKAVFDRHITRDNIDKEMAYFLRQSEKAFERPYGWAWFLKLAEEIYIHGQSDSYWMDKYKIVENLVLLLRNKYFDFLPKLAYAVRSGEHTNTAFGLLLAWDFATTTKDEEFQKLIQNHAMKLYSLDKGCPLEWEPSGYDFLSPCLVEALLMKKIQDAASFEKWLKSFLPQLYHPKFEIDLASVLDREDGKLVHLDGYNLIVAHCFYGLVANNDKLTHLIKFANRITKETLDRIADGHYAGEHWLASFAVLATLEWRQI